MTLRRALKRLRLKNGDILLVHRDLQSVVFAQRGVIRSATHVPVIFIENKNDILRLPFEKLEQIYLEAKKNLKSIAQPTL